MQKIYIIITNYIFLLVEDKKDMKEKKHKLNYKISLI